MIAKQILEFTDEEMDALRTTGELLSFIQNSQLDGKCDELGAQGQAIIKALLPILTYVKENCTKD